MLAAVAEVARTLDRLDCQNGQAAAHVCRGFVCQAPVEEPEGLLAQLDRRRT